MVPLYVSGRVRFSSRFQRTVLLIVVFTVHILNGWYERMEIAINIGGGAQALVENTVFEYVDVCFTGSGYLVVRGSELGTCLNTVPPGGFITLPYLSTPAPAPNVKAIVAANQGAILIWT